MTLEERRIQNTEINEKTDKANKLYYTMKKEFICKREVAKETKMKVLKVVYRPILTYGCEQQLISHKQKRKIKAAEMKYLRKVKGKKRTDRTKNDLIREQPKVESMACYME